jgi:hypothetical protein
MKIGQETPVFYPFGWQSGPPGTGMNGSMLMNGTRLDEIRDVAAKSWTWRLANDQDRARGVKARLK